MSRNAAGAQANQNVDYLYQSGTVSSTNWAPISGDAGVCGFLTQATNLDGAGPFTLDQPFIVTTP